MSVLITGGAGFIGSHVVRLLLAQNEEVIVVDDLSSGRADRIGTATLVQLDLASPGADISLGALMQSSGVESVIHFAAKKQVPESVEQPLFYYQQNVGGMINLLSAMAASQVDRLVFSSSAAAYGMLDVELVAESMPCHPLSPYGETKLIGEWLAADAVQAHSFHIASLRYFNVAGAGWDDLGDPTSFNLIPIAFDHVAAGTAPEIFGSDYPTVDGTCVRDYVHVLDLAEAHLAALSWTAQSSAGHEVFNIGTGVGASVREVIDEVGAAIGRPLQPHIAARRPGDPARVVADVTKAREILGWNSSRNVTEIVTSAWTAYQITHSR